MKIEEARYETCKECGTRKRMISEESYGCDECGKQISIESNGKTHHDFLQLKVFRHVGSDTESREFCSWACVFAFLPKIESDYFVSLPFLQYEADVVPGQRVSDFFKLLKGA